MRRFFGLTLLAILAIPPPSPAGSIDYTFTDVHWPHGELGGMEVDDSALARGYFTEADVRAFGLAGFTARDLDPFTLPIAADGTAAGEGVIYGRELVYGTPYNLQVDFGGGLGGFWGVTAAGSRGLNGYGYWTAAIVPSVASVPVPEPSALATSLVALAIGAGLTIWINREDFR